MKDDLPRSDLVGEIRFKVPLVIAIPFGALLLIALLAIGLSRVLLSVPHEAATAIAIVIAANVLGAAAFIAARRRVGRTSMLELLLVVLYPVIIGIAIAQFGLAGEETEAATHEAPAGEAEAPGTGAAATTTELVATGTEWSTDQVVFAADEPAELDVVNDDPVTHNMSIYTDEEAALAKQDPLFKGEDVEGGETVAYEIDPLKKGTYTYICDYHTNMIGEVTVE
jgi:plastocyanin